jgi:hypothetical protein
VTFSNLFLQIPVNDEDILISTIKEDTEKAEMIKAAQVIFFDEVTMLDIRVLMAVDRLLRLICKIDEWFGGKKVILTGDFRQIPPVVSNSAKGDVLAASLRCSPIFQDLQKVHLTLCERIANDNDHLNFCQALGSGTYVKKWNKQTQKGRKNNHLPMITPVTLKIHPFTNEDTTECFLPHQYASTTNLAHLINTIFPPEVLDHPSIAGRRCIMGLTNHAIDHINSTIFDTLPGMATTYTSTSAILGADANDKYVDKMESSQLAEDIDQSDIPPHKLTLKIGQLCMIMRNFSITQKLQNNSLVRIHDLSPHCAYVQLLSDIGKVGIDSATIHVLPKINFSIFSGKKGFKVIRRQIPLRPAYARTFHRSQSETLDLAGICLNEPVFTHGLMYMAFSRCRLSSDILCYVTDDMHKFSYNFQGKTHKIYNMINVVYKELLLP